MILSLNKNDLLTYIINQLNFFFPDNYHIDRTDLIKSFNLTLDKLDYCFKHISQKGYFENNQTMFNHLHSDQYCQLLYIFSNTLWNETHNRIVCDKLFYLNKVLHSVHITYKVNLPNIFIFTHPVGTVLGDAEYGDYLAILQNVTVNQANGTNGTPKLVIGKGVFLGAGCKIIGGGFINNYCAIGANTLVHNPNIPENHIVFTGPNGLQIKPSNKGCFAQYYFSTPIIKN